MASTICLVFAFVLFTIAAVSHWREPNPYYPSTVAAGLAFWVLASLLPLVIR